MSRAVQGRNIVYNHNTYVSHRHALASQNSFDDTLTAFACSGGFNCGTWHGPVGTRYGVYNGFNRGGVLRTFTCHTDPAFGGGFHVGGFHGGGGLHGGGGHR
jgi:hypothetical protein